MPGFRRLLFLATATTGLLGGCNGSSITDAPPLDRVIAPDRVSDDAVVRHVSLE